MKLSGEGRSALGLDIAALAGEPIKEIVEVSKAKQIPSDVSGLKFISES